MTKRTLLLILYAVFLLGLAEVGSRAFFWLAGARTWEPENDVYFIQKWRETRAEREAMGASFDIHHPVRGWTTRPNFREPEIWGGLRTNSEGLRGVREYSKNATRSKLRIVVLGDSFTFGEGVSDREVYVRRVEERFPALEMINLGVHGYGHDQMLLYFEELGRRYRPEVVMLGFISADMKRNRLSFRDYAKPYYQLEGERLELRGVPVPPPEEMANRLRWRSRIPDLFEILHVKWTRRTGALFEEESRITAALLDRFREQVEEIGAQPLLVYLPVGAETYDDVESKREAFFLHYVESRELTAWNLRCAFRRASSRGVDVGRVFHWNGAGHAVAADELAERMKARFGDRLR